MNSASMPHPARPHSTATEVRTPASIRPAWAVTTTAIAATSAITSPCTDATVSHTAVIAAKATEILASINGLSR